MLETVQTSRFSLISGPKPKDNDVIVIQDRETGEYLPFWLRNNYNELTGRKNHTEQITFCLQWTLASFLSTRFG